MSSSRMSARALASLVAVAATACPLGAGGPPDGSPDAGADEDAGSPECESDEDCASLQGYCYQGSCYIWEGEGEGEQYLQPFMAEDEGAGLVEAPLEESFGDALAVGHARGLPVVFSAESAGDELSGALLVHLDPFGAAPQTERIPGVFASSYQEAFATALDVDLDGDEDLIAVGSLGLGVLLDEGSAYRLAASRSGNLRATSLGVTDLDEDGVLDVYLPGLNNEYWTLRVAGGGVEADHQYRMWTVGHLYYCPASFAGGELDGSPFLLMVGRVCGADGTVSGLPTGPDRLFLLDAALDERTSLNLGSEGGPAVHLRGSTAYLTGWGYTADPDNDGEPRGTLAIEVTTSGFGDSGFVAGGVAIAGFADLDGDGEASMLVGAGAGTPPAGSVALPEGHRLRAVGDADGDGRDELFLSWWPWRNF